MAEGPWLGLNLGGCGRPGSEASVSVSALLPALPFTHHFQLLEMTEAGSSDPVLQSMG